MPNTIHCPSCQRELRVPAELAGKKVKCPSCGVIFTAGVEAEAPPEPPMVVAEAESPLEPAPLSPEPVSPPLSRPLPRHEEYYQEPAQQDYAQQAWERRLARERGLGALRAPAICLLVTGVVGLLVSGYLSLNALFVTPEMAERIEKQLPPARTPEEKRGQEIGLQMVIGPVAKVVHFLFIFLNLVIILAAIMMLIGKVRWLAYAGSILAMVDIYCCCCLPGIGFGIWSLVTLSRPEVQAIFD
jgi:hypothetical protein